MPAGIVANEKDSSSIQLKEPILPAPRFKFRPEPLFKAADLVVRVVLFLFSALMLCTIRHWVIYDDLDSSWVFGLNYAAAHGLSMGRDIIYTYGPLGYLAIPQDLGSNLNQAFAFQSVLLIAMLAILADLFFNGKFHVGNLAIFTAFLPMAAPLFWFNRSGLENVIFAGVLICLVMARRQGGLLRLLAALVLIGVMAMIKLTSGMMGIGALIGFLIDRLIHQGRTAWRVVAISAVVPTATVALILALTLPSWSAFTAFVKGYLEVVSGYSLAMSAIGPPEDFNVAVILVFLIGIVLTVQAFSNRSTALFLALLFAIPLAVSFKHGFVRQDQHVVIFYCFAVMAGGVMLLLLETRRFVLLLAAIPFFWIWQSQISKQMGPDYAWRIAKGQVAWDLASRALDLKTLRAQLLVAFNLAHNAKFLVEPQLREVVGDSTVSVVNPVFSRAVITGKLNLVAYPLVQKFSAYTPYLDGVSADWVREKGPRYIITDGTSIDGRHAWAEAPATAAEMYRWYDTRLVGESNLLLERRAKPRFQRLTTFARFPLPFNSTLNIPASTEVVFWKMHCTLNTRGKLMSLLFRMPVTLVDVKSPNSRNKVFRVLPNLYDVPTLGSALPMDLEQWAAIFDPVTPPKQTVSKLVFFGPAGEYYNPACDVELLHPAN